ncbi:hypothetical protein IEQ_04892 [Bacillus cereus BAG6X1-2]|nr:hypothetical protein IEQ_04892 [Bacillus cereus BAG6X1-2]
MINTSLLSGKPFNLTEKQQDTVATKIENMTLAEKVGQIFFLMYHEQMSNENVKQIMRKFHPGGMMLRPTNDAKLAGVMDLIKTNSSISPFISANLEHGLNGIKQQGESFGSPMQLSATNDLKLIHNVSKYIGSQSYSLGVNMTFSPVVDLNINHLNPITGTRTFGDDVNHVKLVSKRFCQGLLDTNVMPVIKHFPGDGVDDRDHHVLPSVNDLSVLEWNESYGEIYKELINDNVPCVMAGHILFPAYEREAQPNLKDNEFMPATLSKYLLNGLLRQELGFNGIIITDATAMCGFNSYASRKDTLVKAFNSGCDMLLFTRDLEEDYTSIYEAVVSGEIILERLHEALVRILGVKEKMTVSIGLECVTSPYETLSESVFDKSITLIKKLEDTLPISSKEHERILLIPLGNEEQSKVVFARELEEKGFQVTLLDNKKLDLEMCFGKVSKFTEMYDLVIYCADYQVKSNQTSNRIEWGMPAGQFMPWFIKDIPVIMVSFGNPYHLYDAPKIPIYINAYSNLEKNIKKVVEKLVGESSFKGISPIDAFCGRFDTKC